MTAAVALLAGVWSLSCVSPSRSSVSTGGTSRTEMPSFVREGGPDVEAAYLFAVENQQILRYIPCYCGCGDFGHTNNLDCYVEKIGSDGSITVSCHAAT